MEVLLNGLRAAGERSRLRLLAVLERAELTVSELTRILGQSQPRVSRHLRLLCEAGLLDRFQEGAWVFYRLADRGSGAQLAHTLLTLLPQDDLQLTRDIQRLESIKRDRSCEVLSRKRRALGRDSVIVCCGIRRRKSYAESCRRRPYRKLARSGYRHWSCPSSL